MQSLDLFNPVWIFQMAFFWMVEFCTQWTFWESLAWWHAIACFSVSFWVSGRSLVLLISGLLRRRASVPQLVTTTGALLLTYYPISLHVAETAFLAGHGLASAGMSCWAVWLGERTLSRRRSAKPRSRHSMKLTIRNVLPPRESHSWVSRFENTGDTFAAYWSPDSPGSVRHVRQSVHWSTPQCMIAIDLDKERRVMGVELVGLPSGPPECTLASPRVTESYRAGVDIDPTQEWRVVVDETETGSVINVFRTDEPASVGRFLRGGLMLEHDEDGMMFRLRVEADTHSTRESKWQ